MCRACSLGLIGPGGVKRGLCRVWGCRDWDERCGAVGGVHATWMNPSSVAPWSTATPVFGVGYKVSGFEFRVLGVRGQGRRFELRVGS